MAVLELFTGAAGAFVVATHFLASFALPLRRVSGCSAGLACLIELAGLLFLELPFESVDGGGGRALGDHGSRGLSGSIEGARLLGLGGLGDSGLGLQGLGLLSLLELLGGFDGLAVGADDLHAEEVASGVFLEAQHHGFEHVEGLFLVGDEGILLGVAAQADAFLEVVHGEQVVLPQAVEDGEHDDALVVAHAVGRRGSAP